MTRAGKLRSSLLMMEADGPPLGSIVLPHNEGREKKKSEVATKVPGASPAHLGIRSTGYCSLLLLTYLDVKGHKLLFFV